MSRIFLADSNAASVSDDDDSFDGECLLIDEIMQGSAKCFQDDEQTTDYELGPSETARRVRFDQIPVSESIFAPVEHPAKKLRSSMETVTETVETDSIKSAENMGPRTYRVPTIPRTCPANNFVIQHKRIDEIVSTIKSWLLSNSVNVANRLNLRDCSWDCVYLCDSYHCQFSINLYGVPTIDGSSDHGSHMLGMQRLDGDASVFWKIFDDIKQALSGNPSAGIGISGDVSGKAAGADSERDQFLPNISDVKQMIVSTLKEGSHSAVMEATQVACGIYADSTDGAPFTEVDRNCALELMNVLVYSEDGQSWAAQHSLLAFAAMAKITTYREAITKLCRVNQDFMTVFNKLRYPSSSSSFIGGEICRKKCEEICENLKLH